MRWMLMVLVLMLMTAGCAQDLSQLGPIKL